MAERLSLAEWLSPGEVRESKMERPAAVGSGNPGRGDGHRLLARRAGSQLG